MKKYSFEIASSIDVEIEADNKEDARQKLIDNLANYESEMISPSTYVSDGEEILQKRGKEK